MKIILKNRTWYIVLILAAIIGLAAPFRTTAGPVIMLALTFPLADASARWQSKSAGQLLNSLGPSRLFRTSVLIAASVSMSLLVLAPAAARSIYQTDWQWIPHILAIGIIVPVIIAVMGAITRSPIAGRLVMLIIWYIYLSSAGF